MIGVLYRTDAAPRVSYTAEVDGYPALQDHIILMKKQRPNAVLVGVFDRDK